MSPGMITVSVGETRRDQFFLSLSVYPVHLRPKTSMDLLVDSSVDKCKSPMAKIDINVFSGIKEGVLANTISASGSLSKKESWSSRMEEKMYQTDSKCDTAKHIKGIMCDVKNCAYHNGKSECCAGCISVGPSSADSSSATACVTFKPRAY